MPPSADDALANLRKILEHERRLACQDRAVSGGLEAFVTRLAVAGTSSAPAAGRVLDLISGYTRLTNGERSLRVSAALRQLDPASPIAPVGPATGSRKPEPTLPPTGPIDGRPGAPASPGPDPPVTPSKPGGDIRVARPRSAVPPSTSKLAPRPRPASPSPARPAAGAAVTPNYAGIDSPVTVLRGVSFGFARHLQRLGISTVRDLLYHFPRRHIDYRKTISVRDLSIGQTESVMVTIWEVHTRRARSGLTIVEMVAGDESGFVGAVWFNQAHLAASLPPHRQIILSGRVELGPRGQPYFKAPDWELVGGDDLVHAGRLVPIHPLTEGIGGRWLRRLIKNTIDRRIGDLIDHLPSQVRHEEGLLDLGTAVAQMHFPDDEEMKRRAEDRLAFDELLLIQLGVLARRRAWTDASPGHAFSVDRTLIDRFLASLPFTLTRGQVEAIEQILLDMSVATPMTRLLQGDVGSGKTVVAALAMLVAAANGFQSVLMAPTEILAEQHFRTLTSLFERFASAQIGAQPAETGVNHHLLPGLRVELLTGSLRKAARDQRYAAVAAGQIDVLVGTQAVIQAGLDFGHLGLAVVDEQHRFGVEQRSALRQKGYNPDLLVMTATPIPRTLALTLYGDLDISTIRELPPGRPALKTLVLGPEQRHLAYEFVSRRVAAGEQAFVICPLVEESDKIEAKAATAEFERLQRDVFAELRLGLLHGRMPAREKDGTMMAFRAGELQVLVSTAVVEVGIDVPNATVMVVEGADRFGLAQLHQFRGRVGRGTAESYCILLSDSPSGEAEERLQVLARTRDGSLLAEEDLRLRGPGEFFGTRQHGLPDLKVARLGDITALERSRKAAQRILARDPQLAAPEHRLLGAKLAAFWHGSDDVS